MSSDTQYIRGKAQERGEYSEKFMTDGFDRWAQTDAPARVGQQEKIPSDTVNTTMASGRYGDMDYLIQPKGRRTTRPKGRKGMPGSAPHRRQTMTAPMRGRGYPTGYETGTGGAMDDASIQRKNSENYRRWLNHYNLSQTRFIQFNTWANMNTSGTAPRYGPASKYPYLPGEAPIKTGGAMGMSGCPHCMGEMSADGFLSTALNVGKTVAKSAVSLGKSAIKYATPLVKSGVKQTVTYLKSPEGKKLIKEVGDIAIPLVVNRLGLAPKQQELVEEQVDEELPPLDAQMEEPEPLPPLPPKGRGMPRRRQGHQSRMNERLAMEIAQMQRSGMRTQRGRRAPSERNMIVKQVMMERGVSLPQASRIVKEEGLY